MGRKGGGKGMMAASFFPLSPRKRREPSFVIQPSLPFFVFILSPFRIFTYQIVSLPLFI
jgi:hypothetical protein